MMIAATLAALLFAGAVPAVANVRGVVARPRLPLQHVIAVRSPNAELRAGTAFLKDAAARAWMRENRPEEYPHLLHRALTLADWEQVLTSHNDPRLMREALLSRPDSAVAASPARLLELVDRTPALAAKRELYEQVVLDWDALPEHARTALREETTEELWSALALSARYETLRRVMNESITTMVSAAPGEHAFSSQYETALSRVAFVMRDAEMHEHTMAIARSRRLNAGLHIAEEVAGDAADEIAASLLRDVRRARDLDEVESGLRDAYTRLGLPLPRVSDPAYDLTPEETLALQERLIPALLKAVRETPSGRALLADVAGGRLRYEMGKTRFGALAHHDEASDLIVFGDVQLAELMSSLGRSPRDLLSDDAALADAVVLYAHLLVHEAIHHRQARWERRLSPQARVRTYSHESEIEANNAQVRFLREKRASDPAFAVRESRLREVPGLVGHLIRSPERNASDPAMMAKWLAHGYSHVPTLARVGARLIGLGMPDGTGRPVRLAPADAQAELARRRRLPAVERIRRESENVTTAELRQIRDGITRLMARRVDAILERFDVELAKLAP